MAQKSWNDDYIPNEADWIARKEQMDSWQKEHKDPRHHYQMTYTVNGGNRQSEVVVAMSEDDAIDNLKQQWGLVGFVPLHIEAKRIFED